MKSAKRQGIAVLLILFLFTSSACEKKGNMWFRSRKGLQERLQGKWKRIEIGNVGYTQHWEFFERYCLIHDIDGPAAGTVIDSSTYNLQISLDRVHMEFDAFTTLWLRERYRVLRIDKKIMVIYYDSATNGQYTIEFEKVE